MRRYNGPIFHLVGAALLLSLRCQNSEANVIGVGSCPAVSPTFTTTTDPFVPGATGANPTLTATWYEQLRYPFNHNGLSCVQFYFTTTQKAPLYYNTMTITGTQPLTKYKVIIAGTVNQIGSNDNYRWSTTYSNAGLTHLPSNIMVIGLDTTNYFWIVLYTCENFGIFNKQYAWILTNTKSPSATTIGAALAAVQTLNLPINKFAKVDQNYCA